MSYQYKLNIPDQYEQAFEDLRQGPESVTFTKVLQAVRFATRNSGRVNIYCEHGVEYLEIRVPGTGVRVRVADFCDISDPFDLMFKGTAIRQFLEWGKGDEVPRYTSPAPKKSVRFSRLRKFFKKFF